MFVLPAEQSSCGSILIPGRLPKPGCKKGSGFRVLGLGRGFKVWGRHGAGLRELRLVVEGLGFRVKIGFGASGLESWGLGACRV